MHIVHTQALLILQLCGWVFLPVFIASKVNTLPGYISKRFGGTRIQTYLAVLSMVFVDANCFPN